MAQRMTRTPRDRTYNQGNTHNLVPVFRREVIPGQSIDTVINSKFQTAAFTKNVLTPGLAGLELFYVPHRLSYAEWPEFITDPEYEATSIPYTSTDWPLMFEIGDDHTSFMRRGYKLIYNTYFGSQAAGEDVDMTDVWYDDPLTDTVVSPSGS